MNAEFTKEQKQNAFDFNIKGFETTLEIVAGDITQSDADAIVSSDDVYLSMGGGVSRAIRLAAGESLVNDVRKRSVPLPIGSVVATSAGELPANYVFHATTLAFDQVVPEEILIAQLIQRILDLGAILEIDHVALPLLGAGTARLSPEKVLTLIAQSFLYHIATKHCSLRRITITVFASYGEQLIPIDNDLRDRVARAKVLQQKIEMIKATAAEFPDDEELQKLLAVRIAECERELGLVFSSEALEAVRGRSGNIPKAVPQGRDARKGTEEAKVKFRVELWPFFIKHFNQDDLRSLCFALGLEYEDLNGTSRKMKAQELILELEKKDKLDQLQLTGKRLYPGLDWPTFPEPVS